MAGRPKTKAAMVAAKWAAIDAKAEAEIRGIDPALPKAPTKERTDGDLKKSMRTTNQHYGEILNGGSKADISDPLVCYSLLNEYLDWVRDNPLFTTDYVKSGITAGTPFTVVRNRAPSLSSFCMYIGWGVRSFKYDNERLCKLLETDDSVLDLVEARLAIVEAISTQMDEGAIAGLYDANYVAKLRGLRELKDVTSNGKETGTQPMQVNVLSQDAVENLKKLGGI